MTLWVTCNNCGPVLAFTPQGRASFHIEITCQCGVKCVHDEGEFTKNEPSKTVNKCALTG